MNQTFCVNCLKLGHLEEACFKRKGYMQNEEEEPKYKKKKPLLDNSPSTPKALTAQVIYGPKALSAKAIAAAKAQGRVQTSEQSTEDFNAYEDTESRIRDAQVEIAIAQHEQEILRFRMTAQANADAAPYDNEDEEE